ncbi:MAG: hypothetical protein JO328_10270 [Hyphomicrobiales bacterium]|nr:hypothetical protein [Hyphomicrobiales bacterium]MBV8824943.1 hypothetical protein [Hyphomicrobiales bacterium]MBV9426546.1 hypothetical protein [Bradyrhizobiaceae bacterium]
MGKALRCRWLLLLAGLGAMAGCSQIPGGIERAPVQLDPRLAADYYFAPASDPDTIAQTQALSGRWAKMGNGSPAAAPQAAVAATRAEPVVRTSNVQMSTVQPPGAPPLSPSGASTGRTLYDKQPWEVELDNMVRNICRGC